MNTRLYQNETELGIAILAVALQVLADGNSLLDQEVQILRKLRGQTLLLENTQHFVASDKANLGNSVRIPQDYTCQKRKLHTRHSASCVLYPCCMSCNVQHLGMYQHAQHCSGYNCRMSTILIFIITYQSERESSPSWQACKFAPEHLHQRA